MDTFEKNMYNLITFLLERPTLCAISCMFSSSGPIKQRIMLEDCNLINDILYQASKDAGELLTTENVYLTNITVMNSLKLTRQKLSYRQKL